MLRNARWSTQDAVVASDARCELAGWPAAIAKLSAPLVLLAAVAALCVAAAPAHAAATLTESYDFNDTFAASYALGAETKALRAIGNPTVITSNKYGVPARSVMRFAAGAGFDEFANGAAATEAGASGAWTVNLTFSLDFYNQGTAIVDILDLGSAQKLVAQGGRFAWSSNGTQTDAFGDDDAAGTSITTLSNSNGNVFSVTVVRGTDATLRVYIGSKLEIRKTGLSPAWPAAGAKLFVGTQPGTIGRARHFATALSAADVASLKAIDTTAPTAPTASAYTDLFDTTSSYSDGTTTYVGPFYPGAELNSVDDSTAPLSFIGQVVTDDDVIVKSDTYWDSQPPVSTVLGLQSLQTTQSVGFDLRTGLTNGAKYKFQVAAVDMAGNDSDGVELPFTFDSAAPAGLGVDAAGGTAGTATRLGGPATVGARDQNTVTIAIFRGGAGGELVTQFARSIVGGRWGVDVSLPAGTYLVTARQRDAVSNVARAEGGFVVGAAPPPPVVVNPTVAPKLITSAVQFSWNAFKRYTTLTRVLIRDVPAGAQIRMTCKGKGCPKAATVKAKSRNVSLAKPFKGRRLAVGTKVEIRVLVAGYTGKVSILTVRAGKTPQLQTKCLPAGAKTPQACPRP